MGYLSVELIKRYTAGNVARVVADDASLRRVGELLQPVIAAQEEPENDRPISDKTAFEAIKFSATDDIPEVFTEKEVEAIYEAAHTILRVAVTADESTSKRLSELARYLHPLLSQDSRTEQIGWDLEEYIDWYYTTPSREERERYAQELLAGWRAIKR